MLPVLKNAFKIFTRQPLTSMVSSFHILVKPTSGVILPPSQFLAPTNYNLTPSCGMKVKGKLRRRCKDCYFVCREERWYVMCKAHGRHKQMAVAKKPKNTWILTHATQGNFRPW